MRTAPRPLGVGLLGAGPATQAIHLPTLARLGELFRVVSVMDVDPELAHAVARPAGARAVDTEEALLADPEVECVVVCSPNALHARQVIAASERGVRAILCEKPLATSVEEGRAVVDAVTRAGVPLLVGAMHVYDPGWGAARERWSEALGAPHAVRSTVVLPPNTAFENAATELVPGRVPGAALAGISPAARLRNSILGLAVHDLPLVRALTGREGTVRVRSAEPLAPFGYVLDLDVGDCSVLLTAVFSPAAEPFWTLEAYGRDAVLNLHFTPSYVHAGSARATFTTSGETRTLPSTSRNGYEAEWRALAEVVAGDRAAPDPGELLADLTFALEIAERAADHLAGAVR